MTFVTETLTVDAFDALDALKRVRAVIDRRCTLKVVSAVLINATASGITMTGTDLDSEMSVNVAALEGSGDWRAAVNAETLAKILAGSKRGEPLALAMAGNDALTVNAGGVDFSLPCENVEDFPRLDFEAAAVTDLPAGFGDALAFTARGMSTEVTRSYLNGVCVYDDGAECGLVATDGCRMFGQALPAIQPGTLALPTRAMACSAQAVIPRRIVPAIVSMLSSDHLAGVFECDTDRARIRITCGAVTMTSKLVDGTFPDWRRVVPVAGVDTFGFQADREAIETPVKRAMKIGSPKSAAVALTVNGSVRAEVKTQEDGSASADIDYADKWGDDRIAIRGAFLLDFLPERGEQVRLECSESMNPALVTYPAVPERFGVVMPLRV